MSHLYVDLRTTMPRRLFIPLSLIRGEYVEELFNEVAQTHRLAIYWRSLKNSKEWQSAILEEVDHQLGRRLPRHVWHPTLQIIRIHDADNVEPENEILDELDNSELHYIDISLAVANRGRDCGLYLTLNPRPKVDIQKVSGLLVTDERLPIKWPDNLLNGELCLVLHIPRISLLPLDIETQVIPEIPPQNFFDKLFNFKTQGKRLFRDSNWQFRTNEQWFALFKPVDARPGSDKSFIALDFGTTASTIACLPETPKGSSEDSPPFLPLTHLRSWTHGVHKPNFSRRQGTGGCELKTFIWGSQSPLIDNAFEPVPRHVRLNRIQIKENSLDESLSTTPSLVYKLTDEGNERVTEHAEYAIGAEAEGFLELIQRGSNTDPTRFVFAPKRLIGSDMQSDPIRQDMLKSFEDGFDPVETYLRELLDQTLNSSLTPSNSKQTPIRSRLSNLCYSYPVTWTKLQRDDMEKRLRRALDHSFLHEFLSEKKTAAEIGPAFRMDEASAAFMGVLLQRFQGLEGDHLVPTFAPFEPDKEVAQQFPKTLHVLVIDCGGGTTDMVLLKVEDNGVASKNVSSNVLKHFAIDKGGLEVTRHIAEYLKALLKKYDKLPTEQLRTNLYDKAIEQTFADWCDMTLDTYRRRFIVKLYEVAEALKIQLSQQQEADILWAEIISVANNSSKSGRTIGTDLFDLPRNLEGERLENWTHETYRTVLNQIARWFSLEDAPPVDFLLLSGRSSQLSGLREAILKAIPIEKRPLATDFAEVGNYSFESSEASVFAEKYAAKNLVCAGLALNHWNTIGHSSRRPIQCNPIDETRRTRAIGILDEDINTRPREYFMPTEALLIEADNELVEKEREYTYSVTKNTSRGFYLGINFSGKKAEDDFEPDPPQPFIRFNIEGGDQEQFDRLDFVFQQKSSTEITIKKIILHKNGGSMAKDNIKIEQSSDSSLIQLGKVSIFIRPYLQIEDFRMTGRIHLAEQPIDHDY